MKLAKLDSLDLILVLFSYPEQVSTHMDSKNPLCSFERNEGHKILPKDQLPVRDIKVSQKMESPLKGILVVNYQMLLSPQLHPVQGEVWCFLNWL